MWSAAALLPQIRFVFSSSLLPEGATLLGQEIGEHLKLHGDGVKDVAFAVDDVRSLFEEAVKRGAEVIRDLTEESDEFGSVVLATVKTYGDTVHTFVQRGAYKVRECPWSARACAPA